MVGFYSAPAGAMVSRATLEMGVLFVGALSCALLSYCVGRGAGNRDGDSVPP